MVLGIHPKYIMAEMYAKITGCCKGKRWFDTFFSKEHSLLADMVLLWTNSFRRRYCFADKFMGNDNVCVCSMGDGAVRQGALHEAFNM